MKKIICLFTALNIFSCASQIPYENSLSSNLPSSRPSDVQTDELLREKQFQKKLDLALSEGLSASDSIQELEKYPRTPESEILISRLLEREKEMNFANSNREIADPKTERVISDSSELSKDIHPGFWQDKKWIIAVAIAVLAGAFFATQKFVITLP